MIRHRIPRIKDSLQFLKESGCQVDYCLDIGVHSGTPWLQYNFPKAHYVLIEPDTNHNNAIYENYKDYSYELINVAVGRTNKTQANLSCVHDGKTFDIKSDIKTLDSLDIQPPLHSLCKIDVDGYELDVIVGGLKTLAKFNLIVVESQLDTIGQIDIELEELGFHLWDIVNMDYEYGNLHQVDLVFKKNNFVMKPVSGYPDYDFFRQGSEYHESH